MKQGKILIIDDHKNVLQALKMVLQSRYTNIKLIDSPNAITGILDLNQYDVILLDMNFTKGLNTGNEGLYWLSRLYEITPNSSIIMMTAYGDVELAVKALKKGATDFILKPWDNKKLIATIQSAYELSRSKKEVVKLKHTEKQLKNFINHSQQNPIIGTSPAFKSVLKIVEKVATTEANILITGENGTGKEIIAQRIHQLSKRNQQILVSVDLGAIPDSLFESELFGHKKGAFTDAFENRVGKFEVANNGTLFLDEIGNTSIQLQAKLLQAIQNRSIPKVGDNQVTPINIRLICATNSHLETLVEEGKFREDLLYRINTIHIHLPPLRERIEDIKMLVEHFIEGYAKKYQKSIVKIHQSAIKKLEKHQWPGNIRELKHTIEKIVILSENGHITANDVILKSKQPTLEEHQSTLDEMEKSMIIKALNNNQSNMSATAKQLGVTRQTLYNKLKKHQL